MVALNRMGIGTNLQATTAQGTANASQIEQQEETKTHNGFGGKMKVDDIVVFNGQTFIVTEVGKNNQITFRTKPGGEV